jgi:HPt (histidine-containing phosphotransfer) domain-containing protein
VTEEEAVDGAALDRLLRIGGHEFLLEMIDLFLENAPQRIRAARTALEEGDARGVYRAAHSPNLGARALQRLAERLEERAAEEDVEALPPLVEEVARRYEDVRRRLESERKRRSGD